MSSEKLRRLSDAALTPAEGDAAIRLTISEDNFTNRRIDIKGNDVIGSSRKPRNSFPVCWEPIDNGCVNIRITRATPDVDVVHLSMVNWQIKCRFCQTSQLSMQRLHVVPLGCAGRRSEHPICPQAPGLVKVLICGWHHFERGTYGHCYINPNDARPSRSKASAVARPIPRAAPVVIATLPSRRFVVIF
jgi:hypothetical protein